MACARRRASTPSSGVSRASPVWWPARAADSSTSDSRGSRGKSTATRAASEFFFLHVLLFSFPFFHSLLPSFCLYFLSFFIASKGAFLHFCSLFLSFFLISSFLSFLFFLYFCLSCSLTLFQCVITDLILAIVKLAIHLLLLLLLLHCGCHSFHSSLRCFLQEEFPRKCKACGIAQILTCCPVSTSLFNSLITYLPTELKVGTYR